MKRKKKDQRSLAEIIPLIIYGIWSKEKKTVIFVCLDAEEVTLEYDLEGYTENTHVIVAMPTYYNVSDLEL